jgi:hypothetical protein
VGLVRGEQGEKDEGSGDKNERGSGGGVRTTVGATRPAGRS